MVKVWCWFLIFLFYDDENPMNSTTQVQGKFRRFPMTLQETQGHEKRMVPPELEIINGSWKCCKQVYGLFIAL